MVLLGGLCFPPPLPSAEQDQGQVWLQLQTKVNNAKASFCTALSSTRERKQLRGCTLLLTPVGSWKTETGDTKRAVARRSCSPQGGWLHCQPQVLTAKGSGLFSSWSSQQAQLTLPNHQVLSQWRWTMREIPGDQEQSSVERLRRMSWPCRRQREPEESKMLLWTDNATTELTNCSAWCELEEKEERTWHD